jgi:FkbM family methyltransferase
MICHPDRCAPFGFEIDFFGLRYQGNLCHYIDWLVFCYSGAPYFEIMLLKALVDELRGNGNTDKITFFDIGGNAGHHTLFMAPRVEQVYVFEPFPALCSEINRHVSLNGLSNVRLFPVALGQEDGAAAYFPGIGANSGIGTLLPDPDERNIAPVQVPVRNGDALCAEQGLPKIDLMKIDVEGYESKVLGGLSSRIHRDRPAILLELSPESRRQFQSARRFADHFYPDAMFCDVGGRNGRSFKLRPFNFDRSEEVLIVPLELADFVARHRGGNRKK